MKKISHPDIAPGGIRIRNLGATVNLEIPTGATYILTDAKDILGLLVIRSDKPCGIQCKKTGDNWEISHNASETVKITILKMK